MRIVERYSKRMRMFMGKDGWSLLAPLRYILSLLYGIHSRSASTTSSHSPGSHESRSGPKIISVGNIEVGGGGKTPCVLAIAAALAAKGLRPAVVTRGYGGTATESGGGVFLPDEISREISLPGGYMVWSGGSEAEASRVLGDEAVLYLRAGLPLVVDRDRKRAIRAITEAADPTHLILDDAFHRTELPKDLDILLLDAQKPFGNGRLLPYGSLREPANSVARAGAVVFTRASDRTVPEDAVRFTDNKPVYFSKHIPVSLSDARGIKRESADLAGERVALFSGIARPASFESTAEEFGLAPEVSFRFDDHHEYSTADAEGMIEECTPGTIFVTTAKDWGKVQSIFPAEARLLKLDMEMEIVDIEELLAPVL
jgi:tetraacyldisaccharide 4'-kinase